MFVVVLLVGQPVQLSYVISDSMEPTIDQGDGYLLVTHGDVEEGDIVTFYSDARAEYVTHRVVGETDAGYLTQGDNNHRTDQATGHPPVAASDVRGTVLHVGDTPVVLPRLGSAIVFLQTHWLVAGLALLGLLGVTGGTSYSRDIVRANHVIVPLALAAIGAGTLVLLFGAPVVELSFVVIDTTEPDGRVLAVDEQATRTMTFELTQRPSYSYEFLETDGIEIREASVVDGTHRATVAVPPQQETGPYHATIRAYRYPAVLPYGVVSSLHSFHPAAAASSIMLAVVVPVWTAFWLACDGRTPISNTPRHTRWLGRR